MNTLLIFFLLMILGSESSTDNYSIFETSEENVEVQNSETQEEDVIENRLTPLKPKNLTKKVRFQNDSDIDLSKLKPKFDLLIQENDFVFNKKDFENSSDENSTMDTERLKSFCDRKISLDFSDLQKELDRKTEENEILKLQVTFFMERFEREKNYILITKTDLEMFKQTQSELEKLRSENENVTQMCGGLWTYARKVENEKILSEISHAEVMWNHEQQMQQNELKSKQNHLTNQIEFQKMKVDKKNEEIKFLRKKNTEMEQKYMTLNDEQKQEIEFLKKYKAELEQEKNKLFQEKKEEKDFLNKQNQELIQKNTQLENKFFECIQQHEKEKNEWRNNFKEKKQNLKKNFEQKEILLHSNHETENKKLHANYEKEISNLKSQLFLKTEKHNNLKTNVRIFEQESKQHLEQIKMFYEKQREESEINWKNAMEMLKNEYEQKIRALELKTFKHAQHVVKNNADFSAQIDPICVKNTIDASVQVNPINVPENNVENFFDTISYIDFEVEQKNITDLDMIKIPKEELLFELEEGNEVHEIIPANNTLYLESEVDSHNLDALIEMEELKYADMKRKY